MARTSQRSTHGPEVHRSNRIGWLRAAVLGANDGIISVGALLVGVAGGGSSFDALKIAGAASLAAGACSMAVGEYVSVAAQRDVEQADLRREAQELLEHPASELRELAGIWRDRGLDEALAMEVAKQLTSEDALAAHARDELGLTEETAARPWQAAATSVASFLVGGIIPFAAALAATRSVRIAVIIVVTSLALLSTGALGAKAGGASWQRGAGRVVLGGMLAMAVSLGVGALFGTTVG